MPDVILCCRQGHKVRLDPARFWAAARCPRCREALDPSRFGRVARWLLLRLPPRRRAAAALGAAEWVTLAAWAALLLVGLATALLWLAADRWWPATTMLFGPRWLLLLPLMALALAAVRWARGALLPLGVAALLALGPFMGFRLGPGRLLPGGDTPDAVRVLSFNTEGGEAVAYRVDELLEATMPQIAAFQECGPELQRVLGDRPGWQMNAATRGNLCLLTRFPILQVDTLDGWRLEGLGGSGFAARYRLGTPTGPMTFVNVHLETPRKGLERLRYGGDASRMSGNTTVRELGSGRIRAWLADAEALVVAGDFNMPVESRIYREHWGDLTNAWSWAGAGFGGTRVLKRFRSRIDHVLHDRSWAARAAWLGADYGSDHLPLLAVLVRRQGAVARP